MEYNSNASLSLMASLRKNIEPNTFKAKFERAK
jgi:hypothetical protein